MLKPGRLVPPGTCMLHVCYMYVVIGRYMYMYMYMIGSYMYVVINLHGVHTNNGIKSSKCYTVFTMQVGHFSHFGQVIYTT